MKEAGVVISLLFWSILIFGQNNISLLANLTQSNNHFDYKDISGEAFPFSPRINFASSEQLGISVRIENTNLLFFEILASGAYGSTFHSNGIFQPSDDNFLAYFQDKLDAHLRLEVGKMFCHKSLPKLTFGFSGTIDPRYTSRMYLPMQSSLYEIDLKTYEVAINIIPQLEVNINDRLAFTLKMPIEIFNYLILDGIYKDPKRTIAEQKVDNKIIDLFLLKPTYSFGVGYYISNRFRTQTKKAAEQL